MSTTRPVRLLVATLALAGAGCDYFAYDMLHRRGNTPPLVEDCPEGFAECDGNPATTCETDVRYDSDNCGMCGRDCDGGSCRTGVCSGVLLQSVPEPSPSGLASDGSWLVWAIEGGGAIRYHDKSVGRTSTLTALSSGPSPADREVRLELDDDHVYWLNPVEQVLRRARRTDGEVDELVSGVTGFGLSTDRIFFLRDAALHSMPKAGGEPTELASDLVGARELCADDFGVYWVEGESVLAVWRSGAAIERVDRAPSMKVFRMSCSTVRSGAGAGGGWIYYSTWREDNAYLRLYAASSTLFPSPSFQQENQHWARSAVHARGVFDVWRDQRFWIVTSDRDDTVGNIAFRPEGADSSQRPDLETVRLTDTQASELAADGRYLYWSNIENGFLYRMVR